jgi:sRNA-binding regulator protein Hfq
MSPSHLTPRDTAVRRDQERFGAEQARGTMSAPKKKFVAKGHDAQLQEAQFNELPVTIVPIGDPDNAYTGFIVRRDKYTITVRNPQSGVESIVYKHAIEAVQIERPTTKVQ